MEYKALVSFSGAISMSMGEVREIEDQYLIDDLLKAGYIVPVRESSDDRGPLGNDKEDKPNGTKSAPRGRSNQAAPGKGGKTKK